MTKLLTSAQMRAIEQAAIDSGETTGLQMMERAGQGVVDAILDEWPDYRAAPGSATVFCGPGNNGGDGFVIARLLHNLGWTVTVWAMPPGPAPDAQANRDRWAKIGDIHPLDQTTFRNAPDTDIYIDAIFGTGLTRPADGDLADLLAYLAGSGGDYGYFQPRMVAVDVPSGLCADSGRVLGCPNPDPFQSIAPYARLTVTFDSPKVGHFLAHGPDLCGRVVVVDIGLHRARDEMNGRRQAPLPNPATLVGPKPLFDGAWTCTSHSAFRFLSKPNGHKFSHGHALILSGGEGRTGAARLAARAALRVGAGLVTLATPPKAEPEVAAHITAEMMRRVATVDDLRGLLDDSRISALCLGPGFGTSPRESALVAAALDWAAPRNITAPKRHVVLDADALTLIAASDDLRDSLHKGCILTPHMGEFTRLCPDIAARLADPIKPEPPQPHADPALFFQGANEKMAQINAYHKELANQTGPAYSRADAARDAAKRLKCTVLLKGPDTVMASHYGAVSVHSAAYGRAAPWLATAGAGDVLAGMITGLCARGLSPFASAELAAWLHVESALSFGPGLIATDLPEELPKVFRNMEI